MTVTGIGQSVALASVPPVKVNKLPPVITNEPPHTALVPLGAVRPAGSVSVNLRADAVIPLELKVNVSCEVLPAGIFVGENALLICIAFGFDTTSVADAVPILVITGTSTVPVL